MGCKAVNAISLIYIAFFLLGTATFTVLQPTRAAAVVYIGGLLVLPVSYYPALIDYFPGTADLSPYWIITAALPSDALVTKAWIASITALIGALLFDHKTVRCFRPGLIDTPMAGWCLWPLAQMLMAEGDPSGWLSSLYLCGAWGIPWLLGRVYFKECAGRLALIDTLIGATLLLVPIAIFEGMFGIRVYEMLFGPHPFAAVGAERYFGYRPLAMFEDGNQYGLWVSCGAVLAFWRLKSVAEGRGKMLCFAIAAILALMALASQSIGAIILMVAGIAALQFHQFLHYLRKVTVPGLVLLSLGLAIYVSGVVPLRSLAKETVAGQTVLSILRGVGRSSLSWRISQDEKTIPTVREHLIVGSGQWDWWKDLGRRPWGLPLLLIGQFGLIGLLLAVSAPIAATVSQWRQGASVGIGPPEQGISIRSALAISVILGIAAVDALLNAFIFLPAIILAGSIVHTIKTAED